MEYYSVIKKEWNTAMCNNMDGLRDYCTKWSESKKYYTISYDITYKWNLKTVQTNLFTLQKLKLKTNVWLWNGES